MINTLKRMLYYDTWAAQRTIDSVAALPEPSEQVLRLLSHIIASRQRWLGMIEGQPLGGMDTWPVYSFDECRRLNDEVNALFSELLARLDHEQLGQRISYTNSKGEYLEFSWGDTLLHSLLHSQYHRAQIASEVRRLGGTPASTDYVVLCKDEFLLGASSAVPQ